MEHDGRPTAERESSDFGDSFAGEEVGLREARAMFGELVNMVRFQDRVIYLTRHGSRVAALAPVETARTRAQMVEEDAERHRATKAMEVWEVQTRLRTRKKEQVWAQDLLEICQVIEDHMRRDPEAAREALLYGLARLRAHAQGVIEG